MRKTIMIIIFVVFAGFAETVKYEPNAKFDTKIEEILQALSAHSSIPAPNGIFQQPLDYSQIRIFLDKVRKSENLTRTDKELLEILQNKFSGKTKLVGYEDSTKRFLLNLDLTSDIRGYYKNDVSVDAKGIISPRISANLGKISFYSELDVWTQVRNDTNWYGGDYQPFSGETYNIIGDDSSHIRAADAFRGGISAQSKNARIDIAVDNLTSGPAAHNRLILNAVDKPLFYTRVMLDFNKIQYYQIFGVLKELRDYNKYLYYHRIQIPFIDNKLTLGINASVISGSTADSSRMYEPHSQNIAPHLLNNTRKVEPIYLIPFISYMFSEHYTGDRDNKQIGLDFELKLPQFARWYAELMLDDGSAPHTLFSNSWVNKWAFTFGTQWYPVIAGRNALFGLEYCRVEPWVYTHFRGVANNYEHYGKSIGAELGPNSDQIRLLAKYYFVQKHGIKFEFVNNRFNRNVRGGNIGDAFIGFSDSEIKEFLGGNYSKNYEISLSHLFRQFHRYEMETGIFYESVKGVGFGLWGGWRF